MQLARMCETGGRELRHDFRRYYGVGIDEVPTAEAVELACMLPAGSRYVAKVCPEMAWEPWRDAIADLQDTLLAIASAQAGHQGEPPHVMRPRDRVRQRKARAAAQAKRREVRERMESTTWEEV